MNGGYAIGFPYVADRFGGSTASLACWSIKTRDNAWMRFEPSTVSAARKLIIG